MKHNITKTLIFYLASKVRPGPPELYKKQLFYLGGRSFVWVDPSHLRSGGPPKQKTFHLNQKPVFYLTPEVLAGPPKLKKKEGVFVMLWFISK